MNKGEISRQKILREAFKLFATKLYDRVSFSVMEKEIGISRGSMIYYFKNKEGLFRELKGKSHIITQKQSLIWLFCNC